MLVAVATGARSCRRTRRRRFSAGGRKNVRSERSRSIGSKVRKASFTSPASPGPRPGAAADALGTAYCNAAGIIVAEASGITTEASEKKFRPQRTGRCGRNGVRKEWIVLFDLHQNGVGSHGLPLTDQNLLDRTGEIARDGVLHLHRFENGDLLSGLHRLFLRRDTPSMSAQ